MPAHNSPFSWKLAIAILGFLLAVATPRPKCLTATISFGDPGG